MKEDKCVTIRNNFLRCEFDGTWVNLNFVVEIWVQCDPVVEKNFYLKGSFSVDGGQGDFDIATFHCREEAQKCLDELMGIRVEDFMPVIEYEFSIRTQNALRTLGCKTMGEAKKVRRTEFQETPGIGIKSWNELQNVLDEVYGRK